MYPIILIKSVDETRVYVEFYIGDILYKKIVRKQDNPWITDDMIVGQLELEL